MFLIYALCVCVCVCVCVKSEGIVAAHLIMYSKLVARRTTKHAHTKPDSGKKAQALKSFTIFQYK